MLFLAILSSCINVPTSAQTGLWVRPVKMQRMGYNSYWIFNSPDMSVSATKFLEIFLTLDIHSPHLHPKSLLEMQSSLMHYVTHVYTVHIQYSFREVFPCRQTVKKQIIDTESAFMKLTLTRNMKFHSNQYIDWLVQLWKYLMLPQLHNLDIKSW